MGITRMSVSMFGMETAKIMLQKKKCKRVQKEKKKGENCEEFLWIRKHTSRGGLSNIDRNLFRQNSLKRSVRIGRGMVKVAAKRTFLSPNTPIAIICISTREKMVE